MNSSLWWNDGCIHEDIVHKVSTRRSGVPQPSDLNGCGPPRQDWKANTMRMAHKVNQYVNFIVLYAACKCIVRERRRIHEVIYAIHDPLAVGTFVIGPVE